MHTVEEIIACQISFNPVASNDYTADINQVLDLISGSGLEYQVGVFSTVIRGEEERVFALTRTIFQTMKNQCKFMMDIKVSNVCGC